MNKVFIRATVFLAFWLLLSITDTNAQKIKVQTSYYTVDAVFDVVQDSMVFNIINEYKQIVDPRVSSKIGECARSMTASMPESLLTNLVCDIVYKKSSELINDSVDLSLLNIGGFRSTLLKGDVTLGDLYEIFPFDNTVQIACIKGSYLRELFNMFAEYQMQPMGNVKLKTEGKKLKEAIIGNTPLEDNKIYKVATVNFLLWGGDNMKALTHADRIIGKQMPLRDMIVSYFSEQYKQGVVVDAVLDGRVEIE